MLDVEGIVFLIKKKMWSKHCIEIIFVKEIQRELALVGIVFKYTLRYSCKLDTISF